MADCLPDAGVLKELAVRGGKAQYDHEGTAHEVASWLNELELPG